MPSTKTSSARPVQSITRAAQRTRSVIEDLQTRLTEVSQHAGVARLAATQAPDKEAGHVDSPSAALGLTADSLESEAELERQLAAYFANASERGSGSADSHHILEELRRRVIDGVVERILTDWICGPHDGPSALRNEVLDRLIERVLQQFGSSTAPQRHAQPS